MTTPVTQGYSDIVIGLQYGDEGKARYVDNIAADYDIIARFNGGANAGHTVETKDHGKVALNQIPSGIFYPEKILYIGSGCVVNIEKTANEVKKFKDIGVNFENRLKISSQASVVQPHHILMDTAFGGKVGTTKNGIGPCYADRAYRMLSDRLVNIRVGDVYDNPEHFFQLMVRNYLEASKHFNLESEDPESYILKLKEYFESIRGYVEIDTLYIQKQAAKGARILFEGAQSVMLDVTKGSVPYVTSSNTVAAAAYFGGDLSPNYHRKTIGVAKAVMSRVGHGPFASEWGGEESENYAMAAADDGGPEYGKEVEAQYDIETLIKSENEFEMGKALRILSGEYGTVSTRPRRIGAFDLIQLNYAIQMNGVTEVVINKCDILREYSRTARAQLPLTSKYTLDDQEIDFIPGSTDAYKRVTVENTYLPSFSQDITAARTPEDLPEELNAYLKHIEDYTGVTVVGVGVGPEREQFVKLA